MKRLYLPSKSDLPSGSQGGESSLLAFDEIERNTFLDKTDFTWTDFTPALSSGTGTFTAATATCRYNRNGTMLWVKYEIVITTNGSAATDVRVTLPVTKVSGNWSFYGFKTTDNKALTGRVLDGLAEVRIFLYDGTYPGADARSLYVSGLVEVNRTA
jgi:hypothetical protein